MSKHVHPSRRFDLRRVAIRTNWSRRLFCWLERAYVVPQKRISVAYATAGISIICMVFGISAVIIAAGLYETQTIWVSPDTKLTPFYQSGTATTPIGYVLEQDGHRTICRMGVDENTYTCVNG